MEKYDELHEILGTLFSDTPNTPRPWAKWRKAGKPILGDIPQYAFSSLILLNQASNPLWVQLVKPI